MSIKLHRITLILLPMVLLYNCKTKKNVIEIKDNVVKIEVKPTEVSIQRNEFDWFDGKFNADINSNGKANSIKGRVKIRKDSLIWIQIKPDIAIIEAFRVLITPDSVQFIDYINKKYFKDRFEAIKEFIKYDITYQMVEDIFVGNYSFILEVEEYQVYQNREKETILSSSDFKTYVDARNSAQPANYLFQAIWIKDSLFNRNLVYDPANRMELDLQYLEFQNLDNTQYPKMGQVTIVGDTSNTRFTFDYTKTKLNEASDFPFTIPDNYEQIYLAR